MRKFKRIKALALLLTWACVATILPAASRSASSASDAAGKTGLFTFVETVQITPDAIFQSGSFPRINYIPGANRLAVTFGSKIRDASGACVGAGYGHKEYNIEMKAKGQSEFFLWIPEACEANDSGSLMLGNEYYFVWVPADHQEFFGWKVLKYDAASWQLLDQTLIPLQEPYEKNNDPMVASVNGQIDVSGQYDEAGPPAPLEEGAATHHTFLDPDLNVVGNRLLDDTPHICGSSMVCVDGVCYMVTADAFIGDLIVMKYDAADWSYLGMKVIRSQAHWPQGLVYDGERFYVAYLDTTQWNIPYVFPIILNVHLAAFDKDWQLIEDVAVTDFVRSDNKLAGRPWVILHKNRLFVSYDVDTIDPLTNVEDGMWQAFVSVYKLKARNYRQRAPKSP